MLEARYPGRPLQSVHSPFQPRATRLQSDERAGSAAVLPGAYAAHPRVPAGPAARSVAACAPATAGMAGRGGTGTHGANLSLDLPRRRSAFVGHAGNGRWTVARGGTVFLRALRRSARASAAACQRVESPFVLFATVPPPLRFSFAQAAAHRFPWLYRVPAGAQLREKPVRTG